MNLRVKHLHEHELQLTDYNMAKYFDPNIEFLVLFTFLFYHEQYISKNWNKYFSIPEFVHLGNNNLPYCSQIIVAHVHVNVFL